MGQLHLKVVYDGLLIDALTDQWLDFVHNEIVPLAKVILLTLTGIS